MCGTDANLSGRLPASSWQPWFEGYHPTQGVGKSIMESQEGIVAQQHIGQQAGALQKRLQSKSLPGSGLESVLESESLRVTAVELKSKSADVFSCKPAARRVSWDLGPSLEVLNKEDFVKRYPRRASVDTPSHEILDSARDRKGKLVGRKALELIRLACTDGVSAHRMQDQSITLDFSDDEDAENKDKESKSNLECKKKTKKYYVGLTRCVTFVAGLGVGVCMAVLARNNVCSRG